MFGINTILARFVGNANQNHVEIEETDMHDEYDIMPEDTFWAWDIYALDCIGAGEMALCRFLSDFETESGAEIVEFQVWQYGAWSQPIERSVEFMNERWRGYANLTEAVA